MLARRGGRGLYPRRAGVQQNSGAKMRKLPEYLEPAQVDSLIEAAPYGPPML